MASGLARRARAPAPAGEGPLPHLIVNHHFFYGSAGRGRALRGPGPELLRTQLRELKARMRPAPPGAVRGDEWTFSVTVDDGSRSFLAAAPVFEEEGVVPCLCLVGEATLHRRVLPAHMSSLLRAERGAEELWRVLESWASPGQLDRPLRGGVREGDLYRYDGLAARRLKTALNYRLEPEERVAFLAPLFAETLGEEEQVARELYLGLDDVRGLGEAVTLAFHGLGHRLWAALDEEALLEELTPPPALAELLGPGYPLSIPYGMEGSYRPARVLAHRGEARAAFTMARSLDHGAEPDGFRWWHRYDQADLFDAAGNLEVGALGLDS